MTQRSEGLYANYGSDYDRLQPLRIEMYRYYHELALDFLPLAPNEPFGMLDLGCGTGTFMREVLIHYPNAHAIGVDYSSAMLDVARQKMERCAPRATFVQCDLNQGVPEALGEFQLVTAFSALHHLTDDNKRRVFNQIHEALTPGGWFFFIDAMSVHFDDDIFRQGRQRQQRRLVDRFMQAGMEPQEAQRVEALNAQLDESSPEKDRISALTSQVAWLEETGFRSIDYIWHFFMEHFFILRK